MATYSIAQTWINLRRRLRSYAWWISLSLVLIAAAGLAFHAASKPAASTPSISTPQTTPVHPAQPALSRYLWAHDANQPSRRPTATLDPAQRSVMSYLEAHERAEQPRALWDQAVQAVRDYLRAHSR